MKYPLDLRPQDERMYKRGWDDASFDLIRLRAENERLKAALKGAAADLVGCCSDPDDPFVGEALRRITDAMPGVDEQSKTDTDRFFSPRSKYTTTPTCEQVQVQFTKGYFADQYEAGARIDPATGEIINKRSSEQVAPDTRPGRDDSDWDHRTVGKASFFNERS